jgi:hypothetical protein
LHTTSSALIVGVSIANVVGLIALVRRDTSNSFVSHYEKHGNVCALFFLLSFVQMRSILLIGVDWAVTKCTATVYTNHDRCFA